MGQAGGSDGAQHRAFPLDPMSYLSRRMWIVRARQLGGRQGVGRLHGVQRRRGDLSAVTDVAESKCAAVSLVEGPDDRILCVWNTRYGGWAMPGGMVETGETAEEAQRRELREEVGVETVSAERVYEGEHGIQAAENRDRARRIVLFRVAVEGEPRQTEPGCPVAWKTRAEFLAESPFAVFYVRVFALVPPKSSLTASQ